MDRYLMSADDIYLAMLHQEEERGMSAAVAKAARVAEKWLVTRSDSLSARAREMLQARSIGEMTRTSARFDHE
ncbi:MAG: hypothetical protein LBB65_08945 [Burkholderiales bacterium]|nr:hypothetical protein [Burkholderiales bacterium]